MRRCTTCNKAEILCCEIVGSGKTVATMTHTIEPYNEFLCGGCKYLSEDNKIWNAFSCSLFEEDLVHINKDHIERCGLCIEAKIIITKKRRIAMVNLYLKVNYI